MKEEDAGMYECRPSNVVANGVASRSKVTVVRDSRLTLSRPGNGKQTHYILNEPFILSLPLSTMELSLLLFSYYIRLTLICFTHWQKKKKMIAFFIRQWPIEQTGRHEYNSL